MILKGLQKTTLIDFPGRVASTVFTFGCNFRCGFCHNPDLVNETGIPSIDEKELIDFFDSRKKWIQGVCITGGEPTLHPDLPDFARKLKEKGFEVKLDSNGSNPLMLKKLIEKNLVDYIAMDIKTSQEKYALLCNVPIDLDKINQSISLIKNSGKEYEFRTTVIPEFYSRQDALNIGKWLEGSKFYALQQYSNSGPLLNPEFKSRQPFPGKELLELKKILDPFFDKVEIRNL